MVRKLRNLIIPILFLCIGLVFVCLLSFLFVPKWTYPHTPENTTYALRGYDKTDGIDVYFLGTSHMQNAVSPMQLYEENGIVSYNLATPVQYMETSYFFAERIFHSGQRPKLIVMDASHLFKIGRNETWIRYVTDSVPFSIDKLHLINEQISELNRYNNREYSCYQTISYLFPLYKYHDRWKELDESCFIPGYCDGYFLKGYYLAPYIKGSEETDENLSWFHEELSKKAGEGVITAEYRNGEKEAGHNGDNTGALDYEISEISMSYLRKLCELCGSYGCELVLMKVPVHYNEAAYQSAWNRMKSDKVREIADEYHLDFWDLQYDVDNGIDWQHETADGGMHLNLPGGQKITRILGDYLSQRGVVRDDKVEDYEKSKKLYDRYVGIAEIELSYDLTDYVKKIVSSDHALTVLFSAREDMTRNLTDEDRAALKEMGFQTDFYDMKYGDSFAAVWNDGRVEYEGVSNDQLSYDTDIDDHDITVRSAGLLSGNKSTIRIDGTERSMNQRGINIVVIDRESGLVIDRAVCDTGAEEHELMHDVGNLLYDYQRYLYGVH